MAETNPGSRVPIIGLVLVPGLITLGVTILRLVGELQHWSSRFFSASPGGGGAIIGIVWLAPIFGIYFGLKLARAGEGPAGAGKAIGFAVLGLIVLAGGVFLEVSANFRDPVKSLGGLVVIMAAIAIEFIGWPSLAEALLAYGYFARLPVAFIMFFALRGQWGTHYDGLPPDFPAASFGRTYLLVGVLPQLIFWVAFTVITGSLFGAVAAALVGRRKVAAQAAS